MKKGLLALMLLALVAAIPACRRGNCLDEKCEKKEKKGCCRSFCDMFKCKPKCDKEEKVEKKKKKKCCPSMCDMFKCKPKCDKEEMRDEDMSARRDDMAPAGPKRMMK